MSKEILTHLLVPLTFSAECLLSCRPTHQINVVVMRGINDDELPAFVELARNAPVNVRPASSVGRILVCVLLVSRSFGNRSGMCIKFIGKRILLLYWSNTPAFMPTLTSGAGPFHRVHAF